MLAVQAELKKYMAIETEINGIASVHNIGALSLETMPLKTALKNEAASWKAQFALNLHKQCSEDLKAFDSYIRDTTLKLNRKIEDLEDVRNIMSVLKEVREKESEIDNLIGPIEDMYGLLNRYEVRMTDPCIRQCVCKSRTFYLLCCSHLPADGMVDKIWQYSINRFCIRSCFWMLHMN